MNDTPDDDTDDDDEFYREASRFDLEDLTEAMADAETPGANPDPRWVAALRWALDDHQIGRSDPEDREASGE
jgi:hypothetical protein